MFGLSLIKTKQLDSMQSELKGYYDAADVNAGNAYLRALSGVTRGLELPPFVPISREQIRKIYETSAPVQGVINYIARNVGDVWHYLMLYRRADNAPVEHHWLMDLLARPNDRFTTCKFGMAWAVNRLLYGDAWIYAPKSAGKDRAIKSMYLIPSWRIGAKWGDGDKQMLEGIKLQGLAGDKTISFSDVFESFDYSLDDQSAFGTSRLVSASAYLDVMQSGMRRETTSLNNGGVTNIVTPQPDKISGITRPSEADGLERAFNDVSNSGKTKVIKYPIDVHALGNAPVDLNILEAHKEAVTALCFAYNIPVDLYYGQSKYENAKEAKKTVYEMSAVPMANEFAEDLLNYCGLSHEYKLEVDTQKIDVLQDSPSSTLEALEKMHATLNEKREVMGYNRIDEPYADLPMIPLGTQFGNPDDIGDIDEL